MSYTFLLFPIFSLFRANLKNVFGQSVVFAFAQALVYYFYAAAVYLGAFIIISDTSAPYHATYDEVVR